MPDVASEAENSPPRSRFRFGSSPISIVPRPNMPIVPKSCIALMAAFPQPTSFAENILAATIVKTKPKIEVRPVVAARLPAFRSRSWFRWHMSRNFDDSPELCWSFMAVSGYLPVHVQVARSRVGNTGGSPRQAAVADASAGGRRRPGTGDVRAGTRRCHRAVTYAHSAGLSPAR